MQVEMNGVHLKDAQDAPPDTPGGRDAEHSTIKGNTPTGQVIDLDVIDDPEPPNPQEPSAVDDEECPSVPLDKPTEPDEHQVKIGKVSAAMLLMTWSTSSSNVMYPWTFGILGVVFVESDLVQLGEDKFLRSLIVLSAGPMAMLFTFGVNYYCTLWTIRAARRTDSKTLGELGEKLYGKPGRWILEGAPTHTPDCHTPESSNCSRCLRSLLKDEDDWFECNIHPTLLFVSVAFFLMQLAQQLGHATVLAYVSIGLIFVQTICMLYAFGAESPNDEQSRVDQGWEYFVGQGDHGDRYKWYQVFSACGVFIYSCLPNCIVVETMATMRDPQDMEWAGTVSFIFYGSVYLITGIPAVLCWGGNLAIPVTNVMKNNPAGVISKIILIYSTMLDFIIASTTVNRWFISVLKLEHDYTFNTKNAIRWALVCVPSMLLATCMALFVPKLESLTGLLNSITGSTVQITAVALLILLTSHPAITQNITSTTKGLMVASLVVGLYLTITVFVETCYYAFELTDYSGDFWWGELLGYHRADDCCVVLGAMLWARGSVLSSMHQSLKELIITITQVSIELINTYPTSAN